MMRFTRVTDYFVLFCSLAIFSYGEPVAIIDAGNLSAEPKSIRNQGTNVLYVWFYPGERVHPFGLWRTAQVKVTFSEKSHDVDWVIYQHPNKSELLREYEENQWSITNVFHKWTGTSQPSSNINPFSQVYVGVEANADYVIFLKYKNIDFFYAALFIGGILLFFAARKLSRSTIAFYGGSVTLGVVGSLAIVVFLLYRMAPKRTMAISVLIGGWSCVAYILYAIWKNLYGVLLHYYRFVAIYFVSVALISFGASYLYGPPKSVRTLKLIQWALQLMALGMIYYGCQIRELSMATIILVLILDNIPSWVATRVRFIRYRLFPPKRRLLSEAEYIDQGVRETRRALDDLRTYCRSPTCDAWRTMSRLQSPQQFAEFVTGNRSHISDDEILRYSNESETDLREESESDEYSGEEEQRNYGNYSMNPSVLLPRLEQTSLRGYWHPNGTVGQLPSSAPERLRARPYTRVNRGTRYD